ncbi:hypothetical protein [Pseudoxanthomonas sp. SE1]|uniref:hypothetical protein n=1 Tax=Pseudoxanthomonas sp. SE1 TaxID=1664560 RepID=UPI00240D48E9|nr:hypothetical protein [Pseudoxanthomonas sp. SE1]WFC41923.1 hypothetical protein OY559_19525 [Pseudoxanthomonas sp. SE1]
MDDLEIPDTPAEWTRGVDYRKELVMARFSRASYLDQSGINSADKRINPDYEQLFAESLGSQRWRLLHSGDHNSTSGLVIHAFANDAEKHIVIAVRGSDDPLDWKGPNIAVARDGELPDLMGAPAPATDRTRAQMARLQEAVLPGDAWDPQFQQALDFAKGVQDTYGRQGYRIEVTGHSAGGAHAQVLSHTFGWGGRTFDAPGAANIVASDGYRQWLGEHRMTPMQAPDFRADAFDGGFLNYTVNNSVVSHKTGPHIGEAQSISSLEGREGFGSHARYVAGLVGGGINETPLAGQAFKASGLGRLANLVGPIAHGSQHGVDALDRHDMSRIVGVFEEAVRRQEQGERQPLPIFGERALPPEPPLASHEARQPAHEATFPATGHALLAGSGREALARMLEAASRGDADACRAAMERLHASPEAEAWLKNGQERLLAQNGIGPSHEGPGATSVGELHGRTEHGLAR